MEPKPSHQRFIRIQGIVMARVIEFYIPKGFREPLKSARQRQRGKVLEFCSPKNESGERSPFIIWKLAGAWKRDTVRNEERSNLLPPCLAYNNSSTDWFWM
jgi:hypothetical protein